MKLADATSETTAALEFGRCAHDAGRVWPRDDDWWHDALPADERPMDYLDQCEDYREQMVRY